MVAREVSREAQIDAVIALAMAAERATQPAPVVKFHGWLYSPPKRRFQKDFRSGGGAFSCSMISANCLRP